VATAQRGSPKDFLVICNRLFEEALISWIASVNLVIGDYPFFGILVFFPLTFVSFAIAYIKLNNLFQNSKNLKPLKILRFSALLKQDYFHIIENYSL